MIKRLSLFLLLFILAIFGLSAQNRTLTGKVVDAGTGETLQGALLQLKTDNSVGAASNSRGEYSLSLPQGAHTLSISFQGYKTAEVEVLANQKTLDIALEQNPVNLKEIVVWGDSPDANVSAPQTGVAKMTIEEIGKLPVIMGERDVIKALQLTPGVKAASEGGAGYFVRGGTADQNLVLLDNVSLYNASHLMGFFSTFNTDIVRDVTLYKGSLPAQYGGRLSSVLDVQQRNGNVYKYGASGGIGLISSNLTLEGPIQKGHTSFIVGARRTYADAVARLSGVEEAQGAYLYFYDLNLKANVAAGKKDMISISGYLGQDKMVLKDFADTDWGNTFGSVRWTHLFNTSWTSSTTLSYVRYKYHANLEMEGTEAEGQALINDWAFKQEFVYTASRHQVRLGFQSTYHKLSPLEANLNETRLNLHPRYGSDNGLYASHQLKLNDQLELQYGVRLSLFAALGKGEYYTMNADNEVVDSTYYSSLAQVVKSYFNVEPRFSASYKLTDASSLKAAYSRNVQNMHLLSLQAAGTPYDRWVMSSNTIEPETAHQFSLGYFQNFLRNTYELSVEVYYKAMNNIYDFKDNANFMGKDVVETEVLPGIGRAYGLEIMFKKRTGAFTGWVAYTLSKSEKKIEGINFDRWYYAYQDRLHDISIVAMYDLNKKLSLSAAWVYYTGNALTYPSGKYHINGREYRYYAERNGYRAPDYHRLDLGAIWKLKTEGKYTSELAFSLYNAYGRENAYFITFRTDEDDPLQSHAYQYALFRFIPSISWNFKF